MRPFFHVSIEELERLFDERRSERAFLESLLQALANRKRPAALDLRRRAIQALSVMARSDEPATRPSSSQPQLSDRAARAWEPAPADASMDTSGDADEDTLVAAEALKASAGRDDIENNDLEGWSSADVNDAGSPSTIHDRAFGNDAKAILDAWTALEVLSPQTYKSPQDLVNGDPRLVAWLDKGGLPWTTARGGPPRTRLFYHVILGAIRIDRASESLLQVFRDNRVERPRTGGFAALASVTVDRNGRPVAPAGIAISSFAWGFGRVREGGLRQLGRWPEVESRLLAELARRLTSTDAEGELLLLSREIIDEAHGWLLNELDLPTNHVVSPTFALCVHHWIGFDVTP